jgi:hypothetical protein
VESVRCRPPALTIPSSASRASSRSRTFSSSPRVDEPLSQPRQHRVIESRISKFQAQGVLPVDPAPYGVSGLPIGQILDELSDRDQRSLARRDPWLAPHPTRQDTLLVSEQSR